jgi:hypothetical protein
MARGWAADVPPLSTEAPLVDNGGTKRFGPIATQWPSMPTLQAPETKPRKEKRVTSEPVTQV